MGVLDFLFDGKPPPSVTTYGSSSTNVPSWLSDYTQGLLARANTVAAEPYTPFGGPRVADFSPLQSQAQGLAQTQAGQWQNPLNQAGAGLNKVTNGPGALATASPYLSGATGSYTDQVSKYMNPYTQNVIDRSTELANRNLTEKLLPSIKSNFIKSGAYGSAGQQRAVGQALRDTTDNVQSQANAALADSYTQGAGQFNAEANRNLQGGQLAGSLYGQDMSNLLQGSQGLGALAQMRSQLGTQDIQNLAAAGADQQTQQQRNLDTAYGDFQAQRDYPKSQTDWLSSIIRGLPSQGQNTTSTQQGPASAYQPSGLSQLASIFSGIKGIQDIWGDEKARGGMVRRARGGLALYARGGKVVRRHTRSRGGLSLAKVG